MSLPSLWLGPQHCLRWMWIRRSLCFWRSAGSLHFCIPGIHFFLVITMLPCRTGQRIVRERLSTEGSQSWSLNSYHSMTKAWAAFGLWASWSQIFFTVTIGFQPKGIALRWCNISWSWWGFLTHKGHKGAGDSDYPRYIGQGSSWMASTPLGIVK